MCEFFLCAAAPPPPYSANHRVFSFGDLCQHDMGTGLPFRPATFDGCISVSALQVRRCTTNTPPAWCELVTAVGCTSFGYTRRRSSANSVDFVRGRKVGCRRNLEGHREGFNSCPSLIEMLNYSLLLGKRLPSGRGRPRVVQTEYWVKLSAGSTFMTTPTSTTSPPTHPLLAPPYSCVFRVNANNTPLPKSTIPPSPTHPPTLALAPPCSAFSRECLQRSTPNNSGCATRRQASRWRRPGWSASSRLCTRLSRGDPARRCSFTRTAPSRRCSSRRAPRGKSRLTFFFFSGVGERKRERERVDFHLFTCSPAGELLGCLKCLVSAGGWLRSFVHEAFGRVWVDSPCCASYRYAVGKLHICTVDCSQPENPLTH